MKILVTIESLIWSINRSFLKAASLMCILIIVTMTIIVLSGVFCRYVLADPIAWSEEISKFLMIYATLLGAPIALYQGRHVGIEILIHALKGKYQCFALLVGHFIIISFVAVCIKEGFELAWIARTQRASTVDLSIFWVYLCIPVGFLIMFTVSIEQFIFLLKRIFGSSDVHEPENR